MFHERTKHIEVKYHYVCDVVAQGKLKVCDARKVTRQLGTPRGRYDEHSSKFSLSKKPRFNRTSRKSRSYEGCWCRNVVRRNTRDSGANVEPAQHNQITLPQLNSEVVNLTGLLKTKS